MATSVCLVYTLFMIRVTYFYSACIGIETEDVRIFCDPRYLYGLLTMIFHWDNASVGSQLITRRAPEDFNRSSQDFLNFFHV